MNIKTMTNKKFHELYEKFSSNNSKLNNSAFNELTTFDIHNNLLFILIFQKEFATDCPANWKSIKKQIDSELSKFKLSAKTKVELSSYKGIIDFTKKYYPKKLKFVGECYCTFFKRHIESWGFPYMSNISIKFNIK